MIPIPLMPCRHLIHSCLKMIKKNISKNVDISRFINQDVLTGTPTASQSLNRYAYCQGNPVNQNDPFGLCPQGMAGRDWVHIGLAIAGAAIGATGIAYTTGTMAVTTIESAARTYTLLETNDLLQKKRRITDGRNDT